MSLHRDRYDFCPSESDVEVLRSLLEHPLLSHLLESRDPKPAPKKGKQPAPKKVVAPKLLLSQEHMSKRGEIICSHLIAMPKGVRPEDNIDLKNVFNQHPFHEDWVRDGWNIIHDRSLTQQYPDHDVYWLCHANWLSEAVVKAVVDAAFKAEPKEGRAPIRKITNEYEVVLG